MSSESSSIIPPPSLRRCGGCAANPTCMSFRRPLASAGSLVCRRSRRALTRSSAHPGALAGGHPGLLAPAPVESPAFHTAVAALVDTDPGDRVGRIPMSLRLPSAICDVPACWH